MEDTGRGVWFEGKMMCSLMDTLSGHHRGTEWPGRQAGLKVRSLSERSGQETETESN